MTRNIFLLISVMLIGAAIGIFIASSKFTPQIPNTGAAASVGSRFVYTFNTATSTLFEAGSMDNSTSPYWWVNSGAMLRILGGIGETNQGDLPLTDKWRLLYARMNPIDTDLGAHPQNTFRLMSRAKWENVRVQQDFKIVKDNFSSSPQRNGSNGLLFMTRNTGDGQTLYYAGIRVDGTAVIKKKYKGTYYTMAQKKIFPGLYSTLGNINLLPHSEWIGLRSEAVTNPDMGVTVRLFMRRAGESAWTQLLEATDDGKKYAGTPTILGPQYIGVRTDFMDVQFDNFRAEAF